MTFPVRPTSMMSDRRLSLLNHPFLAWLSGMERDIVQQSYGSDLFLSAVASRRFSIGWDRLGQIVVGVSAIDRPAFASIKWIGAALITNAVKPGSNDEADWFLLVADLASNTAPHDGSAPEKEKRTILSLWLPANVNLLARTVYQAIDVTGEETHPEHLRLVSVTDQATPEPAQNTDDISHIPLVLLNGGQCTTPSILLPDNTPPAYKPRPADYEPRGRNTYKKRRRK